MNDLFKGAGRTINGIRFLSPKEALPLLLGDTLLIDLRTGYFRNGRSFDVKEVLNISSDKIILDTERIPTDRPVIIADYAGITSKITVIKLIEKGFTNLAVLIGGVSEWEKDGMPLKVDKDMELTGGCACQLRPRRLKRILFVCIHNSARSQMAEAFLNDLAPEGWEAESAGIEPGKLNPVVVDAMAEAGIDISGNSTSTVQEKIDSGRHYEYVITVCDQASGERCPVFPGKAYNRLHIEFPDPSAFQGTYDEKLKFTREVRDMIKKSIEEFVNTL